MLMSLDERYSPSSIVIPCEGYYSQSLVMKKQINMSKTKIDRLWCKIIKRKIENQSKALAILDKDGYKEILEYSKNINSQNIDTKEALSAKDYFEYYHPSLNRRTDDPINSALNYGYAVIRNAIDIMLDSIRQYIVEDKSEVLFPDIIPEESMELLNE